MSLTTGLLARCAVLGAAFAVVVPARADITWNWSAGGRAHQGTFTTAGANLAPLAAGNYVITDAAFTASTFMRVGSVSGGQYTFGGHGAVPPYFIVWDGSAVTGIDATATTAANGLVISYPPSGPNADAFAVFGSDPSGQVGRNSWHFMEDRSANRGPDLTTLPVLVPEPASIALVACTAAGLLASGGRYGAGVRGTTNRLTRRCS